MERKVLRVSTLVILCALALRLLSRGALGSIPEITLSPETASWMIFLQTGRLMCPSNISFSSPPTESTVPNPVQQTVPQPTPPPQQSVLTFSPDSAANLAINSSFHYSADIASLLTQPLSWDLTGDQPSVLILHTHATESFAPTGEYQETTPYRTLDTAYNMVSVGTYVAKLLEAGGITVLHDTALHDNPSYNASYNNSRNSIQSYLKMYPSIRLVLDLHRDSYEDAEGNQIARTVFSGDTALAPLMLVVGTNQGGLTHPQWQENLALALKLQTQLETICPGICRPINLRSQRFNQDLSPGALLIEVGASGNTRQEALLAAEVLAEGILSLAHGSS